MGAYSTMQHANLSTFKSTSQHILSTEPPHSHSFQKVGPGAKNFDNYCHELHDFCSLTYQKDIPGKGKKGKQQSYCCDLFTVNQICHRKYWQGNRPLSGYGRSPLNSLLGLKILSANIFHPRLTFLSCDCPSPLKEQTFTTVTVWSAFNMLCLPFNPVSFTSFKQGWFDPVAYLQVEIKMGGSHSSSATVSFQLT